MACNAIKTSDLKYEMQVLLKCVPISKDYVLCDSLIQGKDNCYLTFLGQRYLKKERIKFDESGKIGKIEIFRSEGITQYTPDDFAKDSLLLTSMDWRIANKLELHGDSIILPYRGLVIKNDNENKLMYSNVIYEDQPWLYIASYR